MEAVVVVVEEVLVLVVGGEVVRGELGGKRKGGKGDIPTHVSRIKFNCCKNANCQDLENGMIKKDEVPF